MWRDEQGFGLVESITALLIVSLVVLASLEAAAADLRATRSAVSQMEASALAEDLLFRAQFLEWDELTEGGAALEGRFFVPMDRYHWAIDVRPASDEVALLEARVRIEWPGGVYRATTRFHPPVPEEAAGE